MVESYTPMFNDIDPWELLESLSQQQRDASVVVERISNHLMVLLEAINSLNLQNQSLHHRITVLEKNLEKNRTTTHSS
jgi:hypothetical protein